MAIGRPQADIDWKKADELLIAGCSGVEIAGYFGILPNTLYSRCLQDNGITFSDYSQSKYSKGESFLRAKQYQVAMSGDKTMLVWLGKNRLKQKDGEDKITNNFYFREIDPTDAANTSALPVSMQTLPESSVEGV